MSGTVGRLGADEMDNHSTIFIIAFVSGAVESVLMTDQGSDITAIPQCVFKMIHVTGLDVKEISFSKTRRYTPIVRAKNVEVNCSKIVKLDAIFRIRHGSKLILRNVCWNVTNKDMPFCLLGRPELEALG